MKQFSETNLINIIEKYNEAINFMYRKQTLYGLRGPHYDTRENDFQIGDIQVLSFFSDVVRMGSIKYNFDWYSTFEDFRSISEEISYYLACCYLYRDFINNPLKESFYFAGKIQYPNYENLFAVRYDRYSVSVIEKIYNFWDRIGDLIEKYFPGNLNPNKVYYGSVIKIIPKKYHDLASFTWLKKFKENEYQKIIEIRNTNVHKISDYTKYRISHLEQSNDRAEMETLVKDRINRCDEYRNLMYLSIEGFIKTLKFLESVTNDELRQKSCDKCNWVNIIHIREITTQESTCCKQCGAVLTKD